MDCCHCYQVHFGDTVSHAESSALCTSYQALGSILKHKTSHKTDTDNKQGTALRCAHYITVSVTPVLAAPPTPSILTQEGGLQKQLPPMTQCWSLLTSGDDTGATHLCTVTVTHTWHSKAVCLLSLCVSSTASSHVMRSRFFRLLQTWLSKLFLKKSFVCMY